MPVRICCSTACCRTWLLSSCGQAEREGRGCARIGCSTALRSLHERPLACVRLGQLAACSLSPAESASACNATGQARRCYPNAVACCRRPARAPAPPQDISPLCCTHSCTRRCTYTAWRRTLPSGKSEYKSVTIAGALLAQAIPCAVCACCCRRRVQPRVQPCGRQGCDAWAAALCRRTPQRLPNAALLPCCVQRTRRPRSLWISTWTTTRAASGTPCSLVSPQHVKFLFTVWLPHACAATDTSQSSPAHPPRPTSRPPPPRRDAPGGERRRRQPAAGGALGAHLPHGHHRAARVRHRPPPLPGAGGLGCDAGKAGWGCTSSPAASSASRCVVSVGAGLGCRWGCGRAGGLRCWSGLAWPQDGSGG